MTDGPLTVSISKLAADLTKAKVKADAAKVAAASSEQQAKKNLKNEESTRHSLTFIFIVGFFILLSLGAIYVAIYNYFAVGWVIKLNEAGLLDEAKKVPFLELDKVLSIIVSALGTSLGFIIGYYFKNKDK